MLWGFGYADLELRVKGLEFGGLGFRVLGLGIRFHKSPISF